MGSLVACFSTESRSGVSKYGLQFDLPSDEEAEESSSTIGSLEPSTPAEAPSNYSSSDD